MRVLFAGVDVSVRLLLRSYVQDLGHKLEMVTNGLGCMNGLREFDPDILVMEQDLLWGGSDGVLARMSEQRRVLAIPVILLSDPSGSRSLPLNSGPVTRIAKSVRAHDLIQLKRFFEKVAASYFVSQPVRAFQYTEVCGYWRTSVRWH